MLRQRTLKQSVHTTGIGLHSGQRVELTIKPGDRLPDATLNEYYDVEGNGCSIGPNSFKVADLVKGKKIVIFGLPGAYTPT